MRIFKKIITLTMVAALAGCGLGTGEGAIGGAAIGAGTGAAIASQMSNGAIGTSAALGAAIGLPVGVLMVLAVNAIERPSLEAKATSATIKSNQDEIYKNNQEIEDLRREATEEAPIGNPPVENRDKVFTGNTLGNPLR